MKSSNLNKYNEKFTRIGLSQIVNFDIPKNIKKIFHYFTALIHHQNYKKTLVLLAQTSIRLYKAINERNLNLHEADLELINSQASYKNIYFKNILILKKNPKLVLFNQQTFRFIYYALLHEIDYFESNIQTPEDSSFIPIFPFENHGILGIFLLANEILSQLESNTIPNAEEVEAIRDFYSRCLVDPAGGIGRSDLFYNQPYFNNELEARFNLSVLNLRYMTFDHYAHVITKDPAIIAPRSTHSPQEKQILNLISVPYKSNPIKFSELISNLLINLSIGKKIRGKPFIEADGLYYCLCPELLGSVLADMPHHVLFTDMLAKNEDTNILHDQRGLAFHKYIKTISKKVLGESVCKEIITKKEGEYSDLIIDLSPEKKLMIEFKIADPQDSVQKGNLIETIRRFLLPKERKKGNRKNPGPLQVMKCAEEYRKKYRYKGKIYTAVVYYGWFPEINEFDLAYAQFIKTSNTCIEYEKDKANSPTVLLNSFTWELMLSAIIQLKSRPTSPQEILLSMLKALKLQSHLPSQSSTVIDIYLQSQGLKFSVASLFKEQIYSLAEERKKVITSI